MTAAFFGWIVSATVTGPAQAASRLGQRRSDTGQQRRSERAALFGGEQLHG